jgi:hypothetical protein
LDFLANALKKIRGCHLQSSRQADDRLKARISSRSFKEGDLGAVQIAAFPQTFLGEVEFLAPAAKVAREAFPGFHRADASHQQTECLQTTPLG